MWMRPSMSFSRLTKAPKLAILATLPLTRSPTLKLPPISDQGSPSSCLTPRDTRWFSLSILSTIASTSSPFLMTSDGWLILRVHERSETWIIPSIPSSIPRKAPYGVRLRTSPLTVAPIGYLASSSSHGFDSS